MKRFWIFLLTVVAAYYMADLGISYIRSGKFERYLDSHPSSLAPRIEYYMAGALNLANKDSVSMHWYQKVYAGYPESEWAPLAWAARIELLSESGKTNEFEEEANKFLQKHPDHPKAESVRKKLFFIKNVY